MGLDQVLVVEQSVWLPVDQVGDISVQSESSGFHRESVASCNSCCCVWSEVVGDIRLELRDTDCRSLEDVVRVESPRIRALVKDFFHRL